MWDERERELVQFNSYLGRFINMPPLVPGEYSTQPRFCPYFTQSEPAPRRLARSSSHLSVGICFTVKISTHVPSSPSGGEQIGADPRVHQQGQLHAGRPGGEERCSGQRGAPLPPHQPPQAAGEVLLAVLTENAG